MLFVNELIKEPIFTCTCVYYIYTYIYVVHIYGYGKGAWHLVLPRGPLWLSAALNMSRLKQMKAVTGFLSFQWHRIPMLCDIIDRYHSFVFWHHTTTGHWHNVYIALSFVMKGRQFLKAAMSQYATLLVGIHSTRGTDWDQLYSIHSICVKEDKQWHSPGIKH